jgi:hypothetical protein
MTSHQALRIAWPTTALARADEVLSETLCCTA